MKKAGGGSFRSSGLKKGASEVTKRLVGCGFLPKTFKEELIGDFFIEGFDGLFDDLEVGGVQVLFPECAGKSVAALRCELSREDLDLAGLAKLLEAGGFAAGPEFTRRNYEPELRAAGFQAVLHEASGAVNFIGEHHGLTWTFDLRKDGTLLGVEAHDIALVTANSGQMTEDEVGATLVEWLRASARGPR